MTYRKLDTLEDLKLAIAEHKVEGKKIISHFNQMEKYYSDWEDRLVEIDRAIQEAENITGLPREEIIQEHDPIGDLLG